MKRPSKIKVALMTAAFVANIGIIPALADTTGTSQNNTQVTAPTAATVDAGMTPDNPLYVFEKMFEEVQLYAALKAEYKAQLLAQFAAERLAEAQALDEAGKKALVVKTVEDYVKTLQKAENQATATVEEGKELQAVLTELEKLCDANIALLEKIKAEIPTLQENLNQVKNKLEVVKAVSNLIKTVNEVETEDSTSNQNPGTTNTTQTTTNQQDNVSEQTTEAAVIIVTQQKELTKELVQQLRAKGWGWGEIAMVSVMAKKAEKNVSDIVALRDKGLGWGEIARELGVKMKDVAKGLGKWVHEAKVKAAKIKADMIKAKVNQLKKRPEILLELQEAMQEFQGEAEKLLAEIQADEDNEEAVKEIKKVVKELNKELNNAFKKHGKKKD
ncbi:MAG: DUF5667 domain-containing protein [Bacillota bacterium]|uniref:DUF5667 domain-containing protein n=1 Tax=Thermanaerosceptrum fracticalcis TaxID=1712410 RepID=A0A7G6E4H6_THEFR|nr:DUF5667 domain-containing protein [Thermanaerosceptrum fracticalcis]QNB46980.1 hypothetical protein BR63_12090 [Thermanaerosceptrum fracticalcis]